MRSRSRTFFLRMTILFSFQSRTEDLTHNVRAYVLDWVYMSALYTTLKISVILKLHSPSLYVKSFTVLISKLYLIREGTVFH